MLDFRTGNPDLRNELQNMRENDKYRPARLKELEAFFNEYLLYGGYPAVVLAPNHDEKILLLKELLYSFVKRDITESNISDPEKFYRMMLLLAHQTGSLVNSNELAGTLKLSATAVENYFYVLRKCFHIQLIRPFFGNIRKELVKMPKCYFHDMGMRNMLMNQFNPIYQRIDKGELIENYAFIRLREKIGLDSLFFWRTAEGHEVDFICKEGGKPGEAIEIKYNIDSFNSKKYHQFTTGYPDISLSCRAFESDQNTGKIMAL
jgi:predicted AAA+ superfamily ATPase